MVNKEQEHPIDVVLHYLVEKFLVPYRAQSKRGKHALFEFVFSLISKGAERLK
jgi:hypothetical protein